MMPLAQVTQCKTKSGQEYKQLLTGSTCQKMSTPIVTSARQATKLLTPTPAPLSNNLISLPWQAVAVDVLEVPMSYHQNRYLLVIQDYFTTWEHAIPIPNQTAVTIIAELVKVFSMFDLPAILYSDQDIVFLWCEEISNDSISFSRQQDV